MTHYSKTGTKSTMTVSDAIFATEVNKALLAQVIYVYRSNERQGTSKVKTRSEVDVSHKKIYAQKGTGNARHGSKNAPIFVGGGIAHGPTGMQNWSRDLSKKMKRAALISALAAQAKNTVIHDGLFAVAGKTAEAVAILKEIGSTGNKTLIVLPARIELFERSIRNIENVTYTTADLLNAYDLAKAKTIILSSETLDVLQQRLAIEKEEVKATTKATPSKAKKTKEVTN